jgi:MFS family permease
VVFVAASISGGLAVGPGLLIASRVVQGIGAALLAPAGPILAGHLLASALLTGTRQCGSAAMNDVTSPAARPRPGTFSWILHP